MRTVPALALALALALGAACSEEKPPYQPSPLIVARPYDSNVPASYDPSKPTPLVLLLHGFSATPFVQDRYFQMTERSEMEGFLYAYPSGTRNSENKPFWNATDACCDREGSGVDDVAYLTAVIDDMAAQYNVDPKRVYLVGHSNGGFMSFRMACDRADKIAAVVSLAGATWKDPARCSPSEPVAVAQLHGDADDTVLFEGGGLVPSATETVASWAAKNGCDPALADTGESADLDQAVAGAETTFARHPCTRGAAELWRMRGSSHTPSVTPEFTARIWQFFVANAKR